MKIGIVPASPSHQRIGRIFPSCPSGEEPDRRKESSRMMMCFLPKEALGFLEAKEVVSPNGATMQPL